MNYGELDQLKTHFRHNMCDFVYARSTNNISKNTKCNQPIIQGTRCEKHQYSKKKHDASPLHKKRHVDDEIYEQNPNTNNTELTQYQQATLLNQYALLSYNISTPTTALTETDNQLVDDLLVYYKQNLEHMRSSLISHLMLTSSTTQPTFWRVARVLVLGESTTGFDATIWRKLNNSN